MFALYKGMQEFLEWQTLARLAPHHSIMTKTSETSGDNDLNKRNRSMGKVLDAICASGHRGGTAGLNVDVRNSTDVNEALGVTLCIIPADTDAGVRQAELANPRSIPVLEYTPDSAVDYWNNVTTYAKSHESDTAPCLFGVVPAENIDHLLASQKTALGNDDDEERASRIDIPLFAYVTDLETLEELFERRERGEVQGFILRGTTLVAPAMVTWHRYVSKQKHPSLHPRPFIGVEGSTQDLLGLMKSTEEPDLNVDTLIFTDSPKPETADRIHALHLQRMNIQQEAKLLENPFARPGAKKVRIAIVNVQGGTREDAAALLKACEGIEFLDIQVFLVENAAQLASVRAHAIVLGGGWHGKQHKLQEDLGINAVIETLMRENCHLCALCAGAIQARQNDNLMDEVKSEGCDPRTALGIGAYKVTNNALNHPQNLHVALHAGGPGDPASAILENVPFSNGPIFVGIDEQKMDIIARLVADLRASDIDEDAAGEVVGVQVKQCEGHPDPVRLMAAFHDAYIFTLFLREIEMYQLRLQHKKSEIERRLQCRDQELEHIRQSNSQQPQTPGMDSLESNMGAVSDTDPAADGTPKV